MNYFSDEFKGFLAEHHVFDAWQFLLNTQENINISEYCSKVIKNAISEILKEHHSFQEELNEKIEKLIDKGGGSMGLTGNDIPKNEINILGINVSLHFIVDKYIKDFFQYARNSFDIIGQLINASILANKGLDTDKVDFFNVYKELKKYKSTFHKTFNSMKSIKSNKTFKYISAFNNRIKHTYDVKSIISLSIFGDRKNIFLNEFQKYGNTYPKEEIVKKIDEIFVFIQMALTDILNAVYSEVNLDRFNNNRIHDLFYYYQDMKDSSNNLIAIYIKTEKERTELPNELRMLLLKKKEEIEAYNCDYDDILVRDKNDNFIGRFIAKESVEKDGLIKYRRYILDECDGGRAFVEHVNKRYGFKPMLMDGTVISDKFKDRIK